MRKLAFVLPFVFICACGEDPPPDDPPPIDTRQDAQACLDLGQSCWRNMSCCGWSDDIPASLAACVEKVAGAGSVCTDTCLTDANCRTPGDRCVATLYGQFKVCVTP